MTDADVVVIGGGLAGRIAAMAAADAGSSVHLVSGAEDTTRQSAGTIDVLGYLPGSDAPRAQAFEAIASLPSDHPYRRLGATVVRSAVDFAADRLGASTVGLADGLNALVPTELGVPTPTLGHPPTTTAGRLGRPGDVLLLDVAPLPDFDAGMAAARLDAAVPFDVRSATVDLTDTLPDDADRLAVAHALDGDAESTGATPTLDELSAGIRALETDASRVGVPAMLGVEHATDLHRRLAGRVEPDVFEVPTAPPSATGVRLDERLDRAVESSPVTRTEGVDVTDVDVRDGRVERVAIDRFGAPEWISADGFVLATGGLVGGGLEARGDSVVEPLFRIPIETPDRRLDWTAEHPLDAQPFARFGLPTDGSLRPLDDGRPLATNLVAAGDVLGGFDPVAEASGAGVAIATGYAAGRRAAGVSP